MNNQTSMFFPAQNNSNGQNFSDDIKCSSQELFTAVHNSPLTAKFKFANEEETTLDCSFDFGGQHDHAQIIWEASVFYLQTALKGETSSPKGFNDQSLYDFAHDHSILIQKTFDQIILANGHLNIQQKYQFIRILQKQSELMDLFIQLSSLFNLTVFHQVAYLMFKICEKRDELLNLGSQSVEIQDSLLPNFNRFADLQKWETFDLIPYCGYKEKKSSNQVKKEAENCSDLLANQMYYDKKIKLLSLRECKKECVNEEEIRYCFGDFFKTLAKQMYLSIEGFFSENEDQMMEENESEWDLDMRSNFSSEEIIPGQNVFAREWTLFNGYNEKNNEKSDYENLSENDEEIKSEGRKKRKLQ